MVTIQDVAPGSAAQRVGLKAGTQLLAIDGHEIRDGLDYEFYSAGAELALEVQDGPLRSIVKVCKAEYEPLGCEFGSYLIDGQHHCRNKCCFCFIDQLPKGMRDTLYFKDDDERMSFLFGNYVTLTNLTDREIDRIIEMKISPINISVHTTDPALRVEMMKNKHAGEVLRFIPRLAGAGVALNTQLVLCPGINDGPKLEESLRWLLQYAPAVESIAAVPVGLTRYRDGLAGVRPYTPEEAAAQLDIMLRYGDEQVAKGGARLVYPSDEWFLLSGREIPDEDFYEGYPQLENGVGMWRLLQEEFTYALESFEGEPEATSADLVTGELAAPLLEKLAGMAQEKWPQVQVTVHAIRNEFFGGGVNVAGLVTGGDIIKQLGAAAHSGRLIMPAVMLRAEGDCLLDDVTPETIAERLDMQVQITGGSGEDLLAAMLDLEDEEEA